MKCRICKSEVSFFQNIKNARAEGGSLNRKNPFVVKTKSVDIFKCKKCGHIQMLYQLPEDYYNNYDDVSGYKQYYSGLNKIEDKIKKIKDYLKINGELLEIGCGEGSALEIAQKYFDDVIGVDPSIKECEIAKDKGLNVICSKFNDKIKFYGKIVAFSTFQVFEHLENLSDTLQYVYDILEDGGVGIINVPNGEQIFKNSLYHQILLEHINYFTPQSLITLAENVGFEVLEIILDRDTMEIDLYVRKKNILDMDIISAQIKNELNQLLKKYEKISIYGSGAKSAYYSELIDDKDKILYIFDSDKNKTGSYISGFNIKIDLIESEKIKENDAIVVFASSYNEEIILNLRNIGYKKDIIIFENENLKVIAL